MTIVKFAILEKTSKNGNKYKAIFGYDENGKEYFICFVH